MILLKCHEAIKKVENNFMAKNLDYYVIRNQSQQQLIFTIFSSNITY